MRLNIHRLEEAVAACDMDGMAAVSHKMIPLFKLLGAAEVVALLRQLEAATGTPFTDEWGTKAALALRLLEEVYRHIPAG